MHIVIPAQAGIQSVGRERFSEKCVSSLEVCIVENVDLRDKHLAEWSKELTTANRHVKNQAGARGTLPWCELMILLVLIAILLAVLSVFLR